MSVISMNEEFDDRHEEKETRCGIRPVCAIMSSHYVVVPRVSSVWLRCWLCDCRQEQNQNGSWEKGAVTQGLRYSTGKGDCQHAARPRAPLIGCCAEANALSTRPRDPKMHVSYTVLLYNDREDHISLQKKAKEPYCNSSKNIHIYKKAHTPRLADKRKRAKRWLFLQYVHRNYPSIGA